MFKMIDIYLIHISIVFDTKNFQNTLKTCDGFSKFYIQFNILLNAILLYFINFVLHIVYSNVYILFCTTIFGSFVLYFIF